MSRTQAPRESGLDSVGRVEWGAHLCHFYDTPSDLLRLVVPFIAAGLRNHEMCVWVTGGPVGEAEAIEALQLQVPDLEAYRVTGQLEIVDCREIYAPGKLADQHRIIEGWAAKLNIALERSYDGLRVTGNPFWLSSREEWQAFTAYEKAVHQAIKGQRVIALCTYNLQTTNAQDALEVLTHHHTALVHGDAGERLLECGYDTRTRAELAKAQDELRLYAKIVDNLSEGIGLIRASDAKFVYTNRKFEQMFGYEPGELLGVPVSVINAPNEKTSHETAEGIIASLKQHGTWRGEVYNRHKDGSPFWCYASVSTFEHAEYGSVWVTVHSDITQQKAAEAQLRTAREELERRVTERTAELAVANDQLSEKIADLEMFHDVAVGRELRMMQLEKENLALRAEVARATLRKC